GRFGKKTGGLSGGLDGGEVADAKMAFEANVAEANVAEGKLVKTEKSGELLNSKLDGNRVAANERAKAPTDAPAEAGDLDAGDAVAEAPAQPSAAAAVVGEDGGGSEVAQLDGVAVADMDNAGSPAGRYRSRRASKSGGKSGPGKLAPAMEKTQPLADDPADDLLALGAVGNDIPEPEADEEEAPAAAREQRKAPEPQQIAAAPKPAPRPSAQQSAMPKSGLNFKQGRADQVRLGRKDGESSNGLQWKDQQGKEQTANVQGPKPGSQIEVAQQKTNTRNKTRDLAQVGTAESTVALQKSNAPTTPAKPAQVVYGYDMAPAKKPAPSSTVQPIGSSRTKSIGSIATGTPAAEMPSPDIARGTGSTLSGSGGVGGRIGGSVAPKGGLEGQKQSNGDFERAMDHYKAKRYGNAIKDFEGYLARDGKNGQRAEAELNLARSLKARNRLADAATRYRGLLKRYPAYRYRSAVLVETARLEMQLGNLSAARDLLNQAVADKGQSDKARPLLKEINRRIVAREKARTKPATASKRKAAKPAKAKAASQPKPSGATKAAALL
ncbi:MAG: TolA-binding protein, partial [Myxococcota bacterium]